MTDHQPIATLELACETDCEALAVQLSTVIRAGDLIALVGTLGAGKTVFARSLIRWAALDPFMEVSSPTFTLVQHYQMADATPLIHADLYRLSAGDSLDDLMIADTLETGAAIIEWPDRLPQHMLDNVLLLRFDTDGEKRSVTIYAETGWRPRLDIVALRKITAAQKAKAIILAAGKGTRMGDRSKKIPKPLVQVNGKALIDYALDRLALSGGLPTVINVHHLAPLMLQHLEKYVADRTVLISAEDTLLETGGGVKKALPLLTSDSFTVSNADVLWREDGDPLVKRLQDAFDPEKMDLLLAVAPLSATTGWSPKGDIVLLNELGDESGVSDASMPHRCELRGDRESVPYVYLGTMQTNAACYRDTPSGAFSNLDLFKRAQNIKRFYALIHTGSAHHVGTQQGILDAETALNHPLDRVKQ